MAQIVGTPGTQLVFYNELAASTQRATIPASGIITKMDLGKIDRAGWYRILIVGGVSNDVTPLNILIVPGARANTFECVATLTPWTRAELPQNVISKFIDAMTADDFAVLKAAAAKVGKSYVAENAGDITVLVTVCTVAAVPNPAQGFAISACGKGAVDQVSSLSAALIEAAVMEAGRQKRLKPDEVTQLTKYLKRVEFAASITDVLQEKKLVTGLLKASAAAIRLSGVDNSVKTGASAVTQSVDGFQILVEISSRGIPK